MLTDFPTEGAKVRMLGGRQYFDSQLSPAEVSSTLRAVGEKRARNSYLPKSGVMYLDSLKLPSHSEQEALFDRLGEWCYLRPK